MTNVTHDGECDVLPRPDTLEELVAQAPATHFAAHKGRPTKNGHVLFTTESCNCGGKTGRCPVCDYGLGVCMLCNAAEIELYDSCPVAESRHG